LAGKKEVTGEKERDGTDGTDGTDGMDGMDGWMDEGRRMDG